MKTKKLKRSNENSLLINARQKILHASQKGITKYIFFGSRPIIVGDNYFSLSTEGVANEIIAYMNDLHFVSIGFIDCDFNINSLYLFSNYTQKCHSSITSLDLSKNNIGIEGSIIIAKVLSKNETLKRLNLSRNKIVGIYTFRNEYKGEFSAEGINALNSALKVNNTLEYLDISQNYIGGYTTEVSSSYSSSSSSSSSFSSQFKDVLSLIVTITQFNTSIKSINISGNNFSFECAREISLLLTEKKHNSCSNLLTSLIRSENFNSNFLDLSSKSLRVGDAEFLRYEFSQLVTIVSLDLSYNTLFGSQGVAALSDVINSIKQPYPLKQLSLRGICLYPTQELIHSVGQILLASNNNCIVIKDLDLSENKNLFGPESTRQVFYDLKEAIDQVEVMDSLNLSNCNINSNTAHCVNFKVAPRHINLSYNSDLKANGIEAISSLFSSTTLKSLNLQATGLKQDAVTILISIFDPNWSCETINMSYNSLCGSRIAGTFDPAEFIRMTSAYWKTSHLTHLILSRSDIGARSIRSIFELLKYRPQIHTVEANYCNLNADGGVNIKEFLPSITGLQNLYLGGCKLGSTGCTAIFEGLKFNKSIKKLHLFANSMTGDFDYEFYIFDISAISSMRDALSVNTTIEELDIRNNGLFGIPSYPPIFNNTYTCKSAAFVEIRSAISQNKKCNGNLKVLNILQNKICSDIEEQRKSLNSEYNLAIFEYASLVISKTKKYSDVNINFATSRAFCKNENISRPSINVFKLVEPLDSILSFYGIISECIKSTQIVSLCGVPVGESSADFHSYFLDDFDTFLIAFDIMRSPTLKSIDLTDNKFSDLGQFILAEVVRENPNLNILRYKDLSLDTDISKGDKLHMAKVHCFNFRMTFSILLKNFGIDSKHPMRLIYEFIFGYDLFTIVDKKKYWYL